jgi:hypothetical protein
MREEVALKINLPESRVQVRIEIKRETNAVCQKKNNNEKEEKQQSLFNVTSLKR